ncbi:MAG: pitrilysin family protein [Bacillota bacterium]|jgi:predicted Zn-dependent peptidase|nr:pitrilysin family protein [Bacillota bacterium]NLV62134.1 insulinase family protein [Clostridiaceae bacterium]
MKVKDFERIQEKIYRYDHPSGLKAFVIPKKGYNKKYATFATYYGSVNNTFIVPGQENETHVPDGIAHFLEHKLFEQEDGSVMDKFSSLGSSPNAYTSFTQTVYLFSCTDFFEDNFRLLINYVQHPYLTDESVEKEKGIIGQEIKMYEDNADWRVFFNLLDALYVNHPVKIDIAGTIDSISKITKETLLLCYNTFYHPSNMIILVVGDVEPRAVFEMVEKGIDVKENPGKIESIFPDEPKHHNKQVVEKKLAVAMPQFQMGIKDNSNVFGYDLLKRKVAIEIILSMLMGKSSKLYNELYDEGLINQTFGSEVMLEGLYGFSAWGGQSNEPVKVYERINEMLEKIKKAGLDSENFKRIKNAHEGRFIRSLNSPENISHSFIPLYFKDANFFDHAKVYEELSFADAQDIFYSHFALEPALSVIWPVK